MTPTLAATATAVISTGGYLIACWLFPFAACRWCEGSGKKRSSSGRAWRKCWRCKGNGSRLRLGRKVSNWLRSTTHDAT